LGDQPDRCFQGGLGLVRALKTFLLLSVAFNGVPTSPTNVVGGAFNSLLQGLGVNDPPAFVGGFPGSVVTSLVDWVGKSTINFVGGMPL